MEMAWYKLINMSASSIIFPVPATVQGANNGLSLSGTNAVFGQTVGQAGSPALFSSIRELPVATFGLNILQQAITGSAQPILSLATTWNNAATVHRGLFFSVTNTASSTSSKVLLFQLSTTEEILSVTRDSRMVLGQTFGNSWIDMTVKPVIKTSNSSLFVGTKSVHDNASLYTYNAVNAGHQITDNGTGVTELRGVQSNPIILGTNPNVTVIGFDCNINPTANVPTNKIIAFRNAEGNVQLCSNPSTGGGVGIGLGIGIGFLPTARLHVGGGQAGAGKGAFKIGTGALLTTPENGVFEYVTDVLWFTTNSVRRPFVLSAYRAVTANTAFVDSDYTIDVTANSVDVTLPTAVGRTGKIFVLKNTGGGVATVLTTSSQTVDGTTPPAISSPTSLTFQSTGANWIII